MTTTNILTKPLMRKRHLLLLLLVGLVYGCTGRTAVEDPKGAEQPLVEDDYFVSPEKAQEIAAALPIEGTLRLLGTDKSDPETRSMDPSSGAYQPAYYLFGGDEGGYAIVAATERAYPILGYSETGSIDPENMPCGLRMMLDIYAEQINRARALDIKPMETRSAADDPADIVVKPLLGDILWDQMVPFNGMTPGHAPIGCVATATAQIMRHWRYPDHAVGTYGYMCPGFGYLEHDFNYPLDWDAMPVAPNGTPDNRIQAQPNATIARFIYGLAVAIEMKFGYQGSGTTHDKVVPALIRHYGYSKEIQRVTAEEAGSAWAGLIKRELDAGRPVLHGGSGSGGGHSFVCDGYTESDLFHFNWGWSGTSNGWYRLNALNPVDLGTGGGLGGGYNDRRDIVIHIAPPARILGDKTNSKDIATDDEETDEEEVTAIDNGIVYTGPHIFEPLDLFAGYVRINNMSNPSAANGYTLYDRSDKLIQAKAGEKIEIEVETERTNFFTTPALGIYIDYNDNGVFYYFKDEEGKETRDPNEQLFLKEIKLGTFSTSYTIPTDVKKGIHRLRIVLNDGTLKNKKKPTDFYASNPNTPAMVAGEVEDYFIEIK